MPGPQKRKRTGCSCANCRRKEEPRLPDCAERGDPRCACPPHSHAPPKGGAPAPYLRAATWKATSAAYGTAAAPMLREIGAAHAAAWAAGAPAAAPQRLVVVKPAADLEAFALLRATDAGRFPCPAQGRGVAYVIGELVDAPAGLAECLGERWLVPLADTFGDLLLPMAESESAESESAESESAESESAESAESESAEPEQVEFPSVPGLDPWARPYIPPADKKSADAGWLGDPWTDDPIWTEEYSAALGDGPDPFE